MTFEKDQNAFGFCIKEIRESSELRGKTVQMEHMKTGARLFWVDNGAENMVFSVTFRTLPEDDTGVFHILEHSVLCGSRKYPVREPFVELLKSSMNTFLNAMTFQDMTMYPVSSRMNPILPGNSSTASWPTKPPVKGSCCWKMTAHCRCSRERSLCTGPARSARSKAEQDRVKSMNGIRSTYMTGWSMPDLPHQPKLAG